MFSLTQNIFQGHINSLARAVGNRKRPKIRASTFLLSLRAFKATTREKSFHRLDRATRPSRLPDVSFGPIAVARESRKKIRLHALRRLGKKASGLRERERGVNSTFCKRTVRRRRPPPSQPFSPSTTPRRPLPALFPSHLASKKAKKYPRGGLNSGPLAISCFIEKRSGSCKGTTESFVKRAL